MNLDGVYSSLFAEGELPGAVFGSRVTSHAWVSFDALCCIDGWSLLSALMRQHGDASVHVVGLDLHEPGVIPLPADANPEQYRVVCDDELVAANLVRWWGTAGQWGIHGSRDLEVAVAGQAGDVRWPRSAECDVLSIDAAMRLARTSDAVRDQMLARYDASSWDPAQASPQSLTELREVCNGALADRIDPIVAIRRLVDLLDQVPKSVRRIAATQRLHQAWTRTQYLLLGADRDQYGPLLLAQNDANHQRHANQERALVHRSCGEIIAQVKSVNASAVVDDG